ncbi:hypothetical protein Poli38472_008190 [Pythium oligandrum]|uniref:Uncharacterized protein n=1 Tax=Pythium oligandrum TaxID=41045 RepID=A0A8K1FPE7_PYTOL|nr:hypothetical protein Poli38472_008190 [Pythium oligandrum]|eukprot:TMW65548.1 hypothetical protein Poli38472_008190 [Pythium oligandrum]
MMMALEEVRHLSRWRHVAKDGDAQDSNGLNDAKEGKTASAPVSLRYLDEFVRKLQCAPKLLEHQLFPDAKEITESMGLFNAVRRYLIRENHDEGHDNTDGRADGIVVVGDGNSPRSAALFAYRLRQWKCYSIDPAMEQDTDRAEKWSSIDNLVVIRNKIENVRIRLRRVVLVLVHAHVTLDQAMSAVDAEELAGLVTMPCCNWYGQQEEFFGRHPDLVYDDFSILSDHRELRVWIHPRESDRTKVAADGQTPVMAIDASAAVMKGCVVKQFDATITSQQPTETIAQTTSSNKSTAGKKVEPINALAVFHRLLTDTMDQSVAKESGAVIDPSLLTKSLPQTARVLFLGTGSGDATATAMLLAGYTKLYTLKDSAQTGEGSQSLTASIVKLHPDNADSTLCGHLRIDSSRSSTGEVVSTAKIESVADEYLAFDCVVDNEFLYRGFRNTAKKHTAALFEALVQLVLKMTTAADSAHSPVLVSVTPRKDWRKTEFFANPRLGLTVSSTPGSSRGQFVYSCSRVAISEVNQTAAEVALNKIELVHVEKEQALRLKEALERDFLAVLTPSAVQVSIAEAKTHQADETSLVRVEGIVQHIRRFSSGPSFISIAPPSSSKTSKSFQEHLQVAMDPAFLAGWSEDRLGAVIRLVHKGDRVDLVGHMTLNAQQLPLLRIHGLRFVQSAFQSYQ